MKIYRTERGLGAVTLEPVRSARRQIADQLRQAIKAGDLPAGISLPSTRALAERWNSNVATVHHALSQLTKEGWLVRTPRRGTFVRQREARLTCVAVYDVASGLRDSLFEQALQAVLREELTAAGIEMDVWLDPRPLAKQGEPWLPLVKAAERRQFQALISVATDLPRLRWQQRLPLPTAYQCASALPNTVGFDVVQLAELSVQALAQQGCRSLGLISTLLSPAATINQDGTRHVYAGFYERLMDRIGDLGLTVKNEWIRVPPPATTIGGGVAQERFGREEFLRLWAQPARPDGLIVYPDTVARGVILGLSEQQVRVPAELKLMLHKNEAVDLYCPMPATFAVLSERQIARALIAQVQKQFRGETCEPARVGFTVSSAENAGNLGTNQPTTTKRRQQP